MEVLTGSSIAEVKNKLTAEGSELYEKIVQFKMLTDDDKLRDKIADKQALLCII
jgi:hypothetical protein